MNSQPYVKNARSIQYLDSDPRELRRIELARSVEKHRSPALSEIKKYSSIDIVRNARQDLQSYSRNSMPRQNRSIRRKERSR